MMSQDIFNMVVSFAGFLGTWVLYVIWDAIKDLKTQSSLMLSELSEVKVLVAGKYTPIDKFDRTVESLYRKIDTKVDKL